ncbi:carbohydrate ABC transporter permease [Virgibacillus siamensis]|uniref:carbohydrate ABC transporter permease n=1 Tax=Virgibacillus siamensis TaxID=480071 RepID=UPI0009846807|nr:sugar ABC transporter permease [Virgibacillus siamensis]
MKKQISIDRSHKRKQKSNRQTRSRYIWAYIFILPQLIIFFGLSLYPIVMSYVYSFFDWSGIGPLDEFVGFSNYIKLLNDDRFWNSFMNSIIYTVGFTIISVSVALILALILNEPKLKGKGFYRTLYFLPVVTTTAIVGIIMQNIFGIQGLVNKVLQMIGVIDQSIPWLVNPVFAMAVLIIVGSWKQIGIVMIYWLTGLQMIPKELYEAARIDGAGYWKTLRYVTLPLLKPIGATILLLTVVGSMHVFDLVKTLTGGGPYYSTETLELYIYNYAFTSKFGPAQVGYASSAGVILGLSVFLISLIFGWFVIKANKKKKINQINVRMK